MKNAADDALEFDCEREAGRKGGSRSWGSLDWLKTSLSCSAAFEKQERFPAESNPAS
jgi:hypothetical protein